MSSTLRRRPFLHTMILAMKRAVTHEKYFERFSIWFATAIRVMVILLLVITVLALGVGIVKAGTGLFHSLRQPLDTILQNVLLDAVFILALVEISLTLLDYLREGRVQARYIVDTVLIIMLNEIVSMWFKHPKLQYAIALSIIVATLAGVRIALVRLTPGHEE
jgi:uncharacterized membrane protein (DUF373 family)